MTAELLLLAGAGAVGVRACAGLMLIAAAAAKRRAPAEFEAMLGAYRVLPGPAVAPVARALPIVELALGAALLVPPLAPAALPAAGLLLLFAAAIALNLLRGRSHIACGCGSGRTIDWRLAGGNVALAALLLASPAVPLPGALLMLGGLVLGTVAWLAWRTVAAAARPAPAFQPA